MKKNFDEIILKTFGLLELNNCLDTMKEGTRISCSEFNENNTKIELRSGNVEIVIDIEIDNATISYNNEKIFTINEYEAIVKFHTDNSLINSLIYDFKKAREEYMISESSELTVNKDIIKKEMIANAKVAITQRISQIIEGFGKTSEVELKEMPFGLIYYVYTSFENMSLKFEIEYDQMINKIIVVLKDASIKNDMNNKILEFTIPLENEGRHDFYCKYGYIIEDDTNIKLLEELNKSKIDETEQQGKKLVEELIKILKPTKDNKNEQ